MVKRQGKKVLVIKMSALGDVLATTPLFHILKTEHPDWEIHHLVMKHCAAITENNPHVDKQQVINLIPSGSKTKDFAAIVRLWWTLFYQRYDLGIILHRSVLFQLLCKASGIRVIVGFRTNTLKLLDYSHEFTMKGNRTDLECTLLRNAGIIQQHPLYLEFYKNIDKVDYFKLAELPDKFIAINPGGGNPHAPAHNKLWPIARFIEFIDKSPLPIVVLGQGKEDEKLLAEIQAQATGRWLSFVNHTSLDETAYIIEKSELYLGNDSSLLYLAAALQKRSLGLYGPTSPDSFSPLGNNQYFIQTNAICSPCYNSVDGLKSKMYTCGSNICMQGISCEQVLKRVNELIAKNITNCSSQ